MKTIKELEAEENQVIMNIDNYKGWDEDLVRIRELLKALKDVLGLIDEWFNTICPTDHCRICNECREELTRRITG